MNESDFSKNYRIKGDKSIKWQQVEKLDLITDRARVKEKGKVTLKSGERSRDAGHFFRKEMFDREDVELFLLHHKILKAKGFPVLPTLRKLSDDSLLMTDLSEGGKKIVFSVNELMTANPPKIKLTNLESISTQLQAIVERASENGFLFLRNVYFIVVDKQTGEGLVTLGSYSSNIFCTEEELIKSKEYFEKRGVNNEWSLNSFYTLLLEKYGDN